MAVFESEMIWIQPIFLTNIRKQFESFISHTWM